MYKGYQEAEEPQQDQSADAAAAANHGGCDGRQSDRAKRLRNSSSSDFKRVNPPGRGAGEDVQGSAGGGGERYAAEGVGLGVHRTVWTVWTL